MYEKTEWKDHIVEYPERFIISGNNNGTSTIRRSTGQTLQEGTPVSASNLNKIEQGIKDNETEIANTNQKIVQLKGSVASEYIKKADVLKVRIADDNNGSNTWTDGGEDKWYKDYNISGLAASDKVIAGFEVAENTSTGTELKATAKFISSIYKTEVLQGKIRLYRNGAVINNENAKIKPFIINMVVIK